MNSSRVGIRFLLIVLLVLLPYQTLGGDKNNKNNSENLGATCKYYGFNEKYTRCTDCHTKRPLITSKKYFDPEFSWIRNSTLYFSFNSEINNTLYTRFRDTLQSLDKLPSRIVIILKSYGGGYFDSLAIIHLIEELQKKNIVVEIRVHGTAMSGGFLILLSGTKGYRMAAKTSVLMWHEVVSASFFDISTVSGKESQAEVMRFLQNNVNNYIAERSKMTKEELDRRIRFKELWVTGEQALEFGFIDKLLPE